MKFKVQKTEQWTHINEYEGQLDGIVEKETICAHLLVNEPADWARCTTDTVLDVELWLERTGNIEKFDTATEATLQQLDASSYAITGIVSEIVDEEEMILNTVFPLRIDMDSTEHTTAKIATFAVGDCIQVIGQLKIDFE